MEVGLTRRARDMHILKEIAFGINQIHARAARVRADSARMLADADADDALADMMQSKLDTIAHDVMRMNDDPKQDTDN